MARRASARSSDSDQQSRITTSDARTVAGKCGRPCEGNHQTMWPWFPGPRRLVSWVSYRPSGGVSARVFGTASARVSASRSATASGRGLPGVSGRVSGEAFAGVPGTVLGSVSAGVSGNVPGKASPTAFSRASSRGFPTVPGRVPTRGFSRVLACASGGVLEEGLGNNGNNDNGDASLFRIVSREPGASPYS